MKKLTIKSLQTKSTTAENLEFTCTLMYGNLRVASCSKMATCSEVAVEFLSDPLQKLVVDHIIVVHNNDIAKTRQSDPNAVLQDWILTTTISQITTRQNDKLSERQTLFRLKGDKPGHFRFMSERYSDETCQKLHIEYSSRLEEIYIPSKHR